MKTRDKSKKLKSIYEKKINQLVKILKKLKPEKIILFGSVAQGKIHPDSDIDLCVIKKTKDRLLVKRRISELMWRYNIGFEPEPDFHVYPPEVYYDWLARGDPFIEEIEKGRTVYES